MTKAKKYCSLVCALILVGVISTPVYSAITFGSSKKAQPKMIQTVRYLDESNPSLRRALNIHNLLYEMADLNEAIQTSDDLSKQKDVFSKQMEIMVDCNSKKFGNIFEDPKLAWSAIMDSYEQKRLSGLKGQENKKIQSAKERMVDEKRNMLIGRDVMMDVYQNPSNYGQLTADASFPLWQDQVVFFEKQWDDFYIKMNSAFGAPLDGRPEIDEKTRQNPKKYDSVVKAHQAYLARLKSNKKVEFNDLPPKAPEALPHWREIVMIDPDTKEVFPEMPQVWKDPKMRKELLKANPNSELAQVFTNGDINNPSEFATMPYQSTMSQEYDMRLSMDSLEKGALSVQNTTQKMQQEFIKKVADLGIDTKEMTLASRGDYMKIKKALVGEKEKAISDAQEYIKLLEKQDAEHPELVQRRKKTQELKRARLSERAQNVLSQNDEIVQISQMSPVLQQRLVIEALRKDENALVRLTETNAMNVDQLIRERQSTNKIVAESKKQVKDSYSKHLEILPKLAESCSF